MSDRETRLSLISTPREERTGWRRLVTIFDENSERFLIYGFYLYLTLIIVLEVFRRFVLNFSSLWGEETARFIFIYLTWIGAAWAVRRRQHIRINIVHNYLSSRMTGVTYIISDVAMLIFAYYSMKWYVPVLLTTRERGAVTQALRVNQEYFMIAVLIGFTLLVIRTLQMMAWDIKAVIQNVPVYQGESIFVGDDNE